MSGANGSLSVTTTVCASGASTLVIGPSSLLRAGAVEGEVALERRLHRGGVERRAVGELHALAHRDGDRPAAVARSWAAPVASCGTICADWSTSYSFSHMAWKT